MGEKPNFEKMVAKIVEEGGILIVLDHEKLKQLEESLFKSGIPSKAQGGGGCGSLLACGCA